MSLTPRLILLLSTPPLMWAGNAVIGRIAIADVAPLWLNAQRWMLAFVLLLPLAWRALATPAARDAIRQRWPYLAVLGVIGVGAYNALQYAALRTSSPLNVTLIASSSPVWAMLVGALCFGEKPRLRQIAGALLTLIGVATVLSRGQAEALLHLAPAQGDLLILIAIIGWSVYSWMLARPPAHMQGAARPNWNWAEFLLVQAIFGVTGAVLTAVIGDVVEPSAPTRWSGFLVLVVLFVAVGPSIIAYRCWGLAVAEAGPATAAIFYNLTPIFAALLTAITEGEWPRLYHALAFALIVGGIIVASSPGATKRS